MFVENVKERCVGCSACKAVCPKSCIDMKMDSEGFYYPTIRRDLCISCGSCERACPQLLSKAPATPFKAYYGRSRLPDVLKKSTSGGAFYHLAQNVLASDGAVYGAAFDYDARLLKHTSSDCVSLEALQKSKYLESDMGDVFADVQRQLKSGRRVFFCGTPCQVSGLKSVVRASKGLLLTCDFICHGVPSSGLFREHLDYVHGKEKLLELDFRPKDKGWSSKNIRLRTRTRTRTRPYWLDTFYEGFMTRNAFLRKSCYNCEFRKARYADITIADFWGYRAFDPTLNDERGLSLIVANTAAGQKAIEELQDFDLNELDFKYAEYVYSERDYSNAWELRKKFFELYEKYGFEKAAKKLYMSGWGFRKRQIKYYVKKALGKA